MLKAVRARTRFPPQKGGFNPTPTKVCTHGNWMLPRMQIPLKIAGCRSCLSRARYKIFEFRAIIELQTFFKFKCSFFYKIRYIGNQDGGDAVFSNVLLRNRAELNMKRNENTSCVQEITRTQEYNIGTVLHQHWHVCTITFENWNSIIWKKLCIYI